MNKIMAVQTVASIGLESEMIPTRTRVDMHHTSNFGRTVKRIRPRMEQTPKSFIHQVTGRSEQMLAALSAPSNVPTKPNPTGLPLDEEEQILVGRGPLIRNALINRGKLILKQESKISISQKLGAIIDAEPSNVLRFNTDKRVRTRDVDGASLGEAAGYYPAAFGLEGDRRVDVSIPHITGIDHIFTRPVGLLALGGKFHFDGNIVWPIGTIANIPFFDPEWNWTPSKYHKMALMSEQAASFMHKLQTRAEKEEDGTKKKSMMRTVRKYAKNKKLLEFMRATFDSLILSYQLLRQKGFDRKRLNTKQCRALRRFRWKLILTPFQAASDLKALAGECRAWYFDNGPQPTNGLVAGFCKEEARLFSLLGRALPAVSLDPSDGQMEGLFDRLCAEPTEAPTDWGEFVDIYLSTFKPKESDDGEPTINWSMLPSNHSSLGYSRKMGGFNEAVKDLTIIGFSRHFSDGVPLPPLPGGERPHLDAHRAKNKGGAEFVRRADLDNIVAQAEPVQGFQIRAELTEVMSAALQLGVTYVLDQFDMIPTLPIAAPERGMKTRFPTLELAAANCLHQTFRRAADAHFQRDSRCSADMGGNLSPPLFVEQDGPFYSVDASFATDKHAFSLTQTLYLKLADLYPRQLGQYKKYIPLIMGSRRLLTVSVDKIPEAPRPPDLRKLGRKGQRGKPKFGYPSWLRQGDADGTVKTSPQVRIGISTYRAKFDAWLEELKTLPFRKTLTGAMMGSATSFPVMPLITFYGVWVAGGKLHNLKHYNQACKATGDDAEIPCGQGRVSRFVWDKLRDSNLDRHPDCQRLAADMKSLVFQDAIVRCGVTISKGDPAKNKPRKDYYHKTKSIFKEVFFEGGVRKDSTPTSLWVAPPGGSKAQVNWFTQGTAIRQSFEENELGNKSLLWARSPLRREVETAFRLGMPVREQVAFGGVNYIGFPHRAPGQTDEWLHKVNQFTLKEATTGTGLSPLPAPDPSRVREAATAWFTELLDKKPDMIVKNDVHPLYGNTLPPIKDVIEAVAASSANANLYWAPPVKQVERPSIMRASFKLARMIRPKTDAYRRFANPDKNLGYQNVRSGWEGKRIRFYKGTFEDLGMEVPPRPYALNPLPPSHRLERIVRPFGELINQLAEDPWGPSFT